MRADEGAARLAPGRRLDPPLLTVADEAANIVRIKQLPSDCRSRRVARGGEATTMNTSTPCSARMRTTSAGLAK